MKRPGWAFSLGAAGHAVLDNLFGLYFVYFLLPPVESGLPERVSNQLGWAGLTAIGVLVLLGRASDAFIDPFLAWWSDRSCSRWGRRRFFLLTAPLPFALLAAALFFPPIGHPDAVNFWWEAVVLTLFFLFYTWYQVPYLALMPELTTGRQERVLLALKQAAVTLAGALLVMLGVPQLVVWLGTFAGAVSVVCLVALGLLLVPGLLLGKSEGAKASPLPFWASIRKTLANKPFLWYLLAKICLFTAFNVFRATVAYYPVVLLGKPQSYLSVLLGVAFASAIFCFFVARTLSRSVSNKSLMVSALASFAVLLNGAPVVAASGDWSTVVALVQMALLGWPMAVLLVIPNAIVADLAEAETLATGERREALFYGTQGFFVKLAYGLAAVLVGFLFASLGKDAAHPAGVQAAGSLAAALAFLGMLAMAKFPGSSKS